MAVGHETQAMDGNMTLDDLKKLATGSVLFSLDRIIVPKLLTLVYLLGLAGIALWGLDHLFDAFRFGFGNGLWGLVEVVVFGLLAFVALRTICEVILIFYKANESVAAAAMTPQSSTSLIDDVAGAIEDLAEEEDREPQKLASPEPAKRPARRTRAAAKTSTNSKPATAKTGTTAKRTTARRTARRTPRPKS